MRPTTKREGGKNSSLLDIKWSSEIQVENKAKCRIIFMCIRNIHLRMPRIQANHRVTFT